MTRSLRTPDAYPRDGRDRRDGRCDRRRLRLAALACVIAGATACGERASTSRPASSVSAAAARRATSAPASTTPALEPPRRPLPPRALRWLRGGSEHDTLLAYPAQAVADSANLYILDSGRRELVALRAATGALAWRRSTPRPPRAIAPLPGGGLAVAYDGPPTIALLDQHGRLRATRSLPADTPPIRSLCALSPTHFVVATADTSRTLLELRDDSPPRPLPLPWPDASTRHYLTTQTSLTSATTESRCAVALLLGRGFALYDGTRFATPASYVEPFDLPGITRTRFTDGDRTVTREQLSTDRSAARAIALADDRLLVSFGGERALAARIVDVYHARSGAYIGTYPLPFRVTTLAAHGRDLYVLYMRHGRPAVAALADTSAPPPAAARLTQR